VQGHRREGGRVASNRPLTGEWPYVWLDATYLKVRQGGRIVPVAAIIAVAANTEGRREIIGLGIGPSEAETFWTECLRSLRARGLGGVRLVISDAHTGLKAAISRVFEATWQRCRVHWMRNALAHVSRGQHTVVAAAIRQAFDQPDRARSSAPRWTRARSRCPRSLRSRNSPEFHLAQDVLVVLGCIDTCGRIVRPPYQRPEVISGVGRASRRKHGVAEALVPRHSSPPLRRRTESAVPSPLGVTARTAFCRLPVLV
jgi:hypothetical protein